MQPKTKEEKVKKWQREKKKGRPTAMSGDGGPGEHHYQIGIYHLAIGVGPVAYVQPMHMQRLPYDAC